MTKQEAVDAVRKHGSIRKAAPALGVCRKTLRRALAGAGNVAPVAVKATAPEQAAKPKRRTISERDLLIETDAETRYRENMRAALRGLKRGEYCRDFDMRKDIGAGGDPSLWREVRKSDEFAPHAMEIGHGREPMIYWGHPDSVAGMVAKGKAHAPSWAQKGVKQ
jgi:hypothetical protein